jgi:hypothetical protein
MLIAGLDAAEGWHARAALVPRWACTARGDAWLHSGALQSTSGRRTKRGVSEGGERIAVLALQRLGDVLTAARVTDALSRRRSTLAVEVIHWDATTQAAALLPGIGARHALPFAALRKGARAHTLAPLRLLANRLEEIGGPRRFDRVVNLSSTRFACWLAPALLAPGGTVQGPSIDAHGRYVASHPAIAYLNEWGVDPELGTFAHQDLYALAAGVRMSGWGGLRPVGGRRTGPIVLHPFGSERAKDWRTFADWRALAQQLTAELGRPCVFTGGPGDAQALAEIASGTDATISTAPLAASIQLLAEATGLVSVDTVAIHLAATVDCPTVVLRQGPAKGLAFVPGTNALCVDALHDSATVSEVVMLAARQMSDAPAPLFADSASRTRLRVREGHRDDYGLLGLRVPSWYRTDAAALVDDESDVAWRRAWRHELDRETPPSDLLEALCSGRGRHDAQRWHALLQSPSGLGVAARAHDKLTRRAA